MRAHPKESWTVLHLFSLLVSIVVGGKDRIRRAPTCPTYPAPLILHSPRHRNISAGQNSPSTPLRETWRSILASIMGPASWRIDEINTTVRHNLYGTNPANLQLLPNIDDVECESWPLQASLPVPGLSGQRLRSTPRQCLRYASKAKAGRPCLRTVSQSQGAPCTLYLTRCARRSVEVLPGC